MVKNENMKEERVLVSLSKYINMRQHPSTQEEAEFQSSLAENFYFDVMRYNDFLQLELTLGMFIPCDEKGNVLEKPEFISGSTYFNYQQAKERVLFKGFDILEAQGNIRYILVKNERKIAVIYNDGTLDAFRRKTIEDLVPLKPILTATAIKMIEG